MRTSPRWTTLALVALLPLAACGPDEEPTDDMDAAPAAAPAPPAAEPAMEPMTVMLEAKNESGVTGEVTARHHADSVTVDVNVSGATADGSYPAHVHAGDCMAPGEVLVPLTSLEVTGGTGMSTSTLAATQVPQDQPAVVQVHDPSGSPVACADLMGHGDMGAGAEGDAAGAGEAADTTGGL